MNTLPQHRTLHWRDLVSYKYVVRCQLVKKYILLYFTKFINKINQLFLKNYPFVQKRYSKILHKDPVPCTVIYFISISAKFGMCTIVGLIGTFVEANLNIGANECA
jgi:hypothetical protein